MSGGQYSDILSRRTSSSHFRKHAKRVGARGRVSREATTEPLDVVERRIDPKAEEWLDCMDGVTQQYSVGTAMHDRAAVLEGRQPLLALCGEGSEAVVIDEVHKGWQVRLEQSLGLFSSLG